LFIEFIMTSTLNKNQRNVDYFDINDGKDKRASFIFANTSKQTKEKKKIEEDISLQKDVSD
jgi:hypothetical protein